MRLPEPFCQFCRKDDGTFDYDEWHAILLGLLFPFWLWPFIIWRDSGSAYALFLTEPWYIGGGMLVRLGGLILVAGALL